MRKYIDWIVVLGCILVIAFLVVWINNRPVTATNGLTGVVPTPTVKLSVLQYNKALEEYRKDPNPTTYKNVLDTANKIQKQN